MLATVAGIIIIIIAIRAGDGRALDELLPETLLDPLELGLLLGPRETSPLVSRVYASSSRSVRPACLQGTGIDRGRANEGSAFSNHGARLFSRGE